LPATRTIPSVASVSFMSMRMSVDLPDPEWPTMNTNSPRAIERVQLSRPTSPPG
jgi:hypothetical protein